MIIPLWLVFLVTSGIVGHLKGYPAMGWLLGAFLGPIGLLIVALSADKAKQPANDPAMEFARKMGKARNK